MADTEHTEMAHETRHVPLEDFGGTQKNKTAPPSHFSIRKIPNSYIFMAFCMIAAVSAFGWKILGSVSSTKIATVELNALVSEYVRAQANSGTSSEQGAAETAIFMASLETALQKKAKSGVVILVSDAIVAGNVPDITQDIRNNVYATVSMPVAQEQSAVAAKMQAYAAEEVGYDQN